MAQASYLLVDAHNVIHALDTLRSLLSESQDTARDKLAELLRSIHDAEGVRVAMILDSRNDSLEVEHPYGGKTFEYLYAPASLSADGVIERLLQRIKDTGKVTVVSNDNMIREATRSVGAIALRPDEMEEWAKACESRLRQEAIRRNAKNSDSFKNNLDFDF